MRTNTLPPVDSPVSFTWDGQRRVGVVVSHDPLGLTIATGGGFFALQSGTGDPLGAVAAFDVREA